MNLVDSSAWLEYFAGGPNAGYFAAAIKDTKVLLIPSIVLAEVFKRLFLQRGEDAALEITAAMMQGTMADLETRTAQLGHECRLAMADSIILGTARVHDATLWTQNADFKGLRKVRSRAQNWFCFWSRRRSLLFAAVHTDPKIG